MAVDVSQLKQYDENSFQEEQNYQEQNDELLALQSIFDGSCVRSVQVLNSIGEDDRGHIVHITIPILPSEEELKVKVEKSKDDLRDVALEGATAQYSDDIIRLEKYGDIKPRPLPVKYLPPLTLQAVLPPTYPSQHAPDFKVSCVWLTANQLSALCGQLDRLWDQSQNLPVLFTWIDWLENNVFSYLDIGTTVAVSVDGTEVDSRVQRNHDISQALATILQYDDEEFRRSSHECPVCCEELPGGQFCRLDCGHHFCVDCLTDYCQHHVSIGTVQNLGCPDTECDSGLQPHIIQSVLPADQFSRWERLLLQRALESMADMDWCPRCNNPVIRELYDDSNLGRCTICYFTFCKACRDPWHQGHCVTLEEQLEAIERTSGIERERFEERRRKLEEEFRSRLCLHEKYKSCPKCSVKIEKIDGCNFMRCTCGTNFCWMCGQAVEDYEHFRMWNSRCNVLDLRGLTYLLDDITPENAGYVEDLLYGPPGARPAAPRIRYRPPVGGTRCPSCGYRNLKTERNNHIRCGGCGSNYCYMCRGKIVGVITAHFTFGKCHHHS